MLLRLLFQETKHQVSAISVYVMRFGLEFEQACVFEYTNAYFF